MDISTFVRYVYDLARKDGKGNVVSPQAIVNWLTYVMLDDFNSLLTQALTLAEQKQVALANVIFDIKDLRQFVKTTLISPSMYAPIGGISQSKAPLPDDFKYELGCTYNMVNVDMLSSTLLPKYRGSVINGNPEESPKGFVGGGYIEFLPNDISDCVLVYLRTPAKPYYDFCMDENDAEIFMPVGSTIQVYYDEPGVPNGYALYDSTGALMQSGVIKAGVSFPYTSLSVDLDWDEINHVRFANNVAHKLGINLKNPILTQTQ